MHRRHVSQLEVVVEERTLNAVGFVPYRTCTFGWFQKETSFCENGVLPPTLTIYYPHTPDDRTPQRERRREFMPVSRSRQPPHNPTQRRKETGSVRAACCPYRRPFASLVVAPRENRSDSSATRRPMTRRGHAGTS